MRFSAKPSPAMIVAVIALALGMVGTAVAGTDGLNAKLSKSKVKKIADKEIAKKAPGLSVSHAGSADSATTANSANRADSADSATTAGSANGVTPVKINFTPTGNASGTVFHAGGLKIDATCSGGSLTQLDATVDADGGRFAGYAEDILNETRGLFDNHTMNTTETEDLIGASPDHQFISINYWAVNGTVVTISMFADDSNNTAACLVYGTAEVS